MPASTRFALSAHLLALLAADRAAPKTSHTLAQSVGANPAVIRRLLGALAQAGLVRTRMGKGGGAMLAHGPKKISLAEIYRAVEPPGLIATHRGAPNPGCAVGGAIAPALADAAGAAEAAFMAALDSVSLKQFCKEIAAHHAAAKSAA